MTGILDSDYVFELIISYQDIQTNLILKDRTRPEGLLQIINSSNYREVDI